MSAAPENETPDERLKRLYLVSAEALVEAAKPLGLTNQELGVVCSYMLGNLILGLSERPKDIRIILRQVMLDALEIAGMEVKARAEGLVVEEWLA